eukprot:6175111-Pleurochrysis_carterae.AAC.3
MPRATASLERKDCSELSPPSSRLHEEFVRSHRGQRELAQRGVTVAPSPTIAPQLRPSLERLPPTSHSLGLLPPLPPPPAAALFAPTNSIRGESVMRTACASGRLGLSTAPPEQPAAPSSAPMCFESPPPSTCPFSAADADRTELGPGLSGWSDALHPPRKDLLSESGEGTCTVAVASLKAVRGALISPERRACALSPVRSVDPALVDLSLDVRSSFSVAGFLTPAFAFLSLGIAFLSRSRSFSFSFSAAADLRLPAT